MRSPSRENRLPRHPRGTALPVPRSEANGSWAGQWELIRDHARRSGSSTPTAWPSRAGPGCGEDSLPARSMDQPTPAGQREVHRGLADRLRADGHQVRAGHGCQRLLAKGRRIGALASAAGKPIGGDVFVLSAGVHSPQIARTVGVRLPIARQGLQRHFSGEQRRGCGAADRPVDEELLVAGANGRPLRITSSANSPVTRPHIATATFRIIRKLAETLCRRGRLRARHLPRMQPADDPGGHRFSRPAGYDNLYINSGHGHMGSPWPRLGAGSWPI